MSDCGDEADDRLYDLDEMLECRNCGEKNFNFDARTGERACEQCGLVAEEGVVACKRSFSDFQRESRIVEKGSAQQIVAELERRMQEVFRSLEVCRLRPNFAIRRLSFAPDFCDSAFAVFA